MKTLVAILALLIASGNAGSAGAQTANRTRWESIAKRVTITRDDWGIAHITGKTDADVVFGTIYAQAEDDFHRVETNFINSQGRLAEAEGEAEIWRDLRMKLFINPDSMKAKYRTSPLFLKALMVAWADGLNYYLAKHPGVKPRVIAKFEPWMALTFSEGSIGGDIEKVDLRELRQLYGTPTEAAAPTRQDIYEELDDEPRGSNGVAIAPSNTVNKHALLLINPHTSFFFRSEVQMTSEEGLNAYGAITWGQFFIYQGFNAKAGWMHTTSGVDDADEYKETVSQANGRSVYAYGNQKRPVTVEQIMIPYKTATGMAKRTFTVFRTHHGPVIRKADDKWISLRIMQEPVKALTQSYTRTKATDYASFSKTMENHTNSSNNTIFADASGNIAYFHSNFIPKRDPNFDWSQPVDGSDPATEWKGVLSVMESPHLLNPKSGWLYNANNWPWSAAGESSQKASDFPAYVETGTENPRGLHALTLFPNKKDFTLDGLVTAAYDGFLPSFATLVPSLLKAYEGAPASHPLKAKLAEQIAALRGWNYRASVESVPTALATFYGDAIRRANAMGARRSGMTSDDFIAANATTDQQLTALATASDKLTADFGKWNTTWGEINRFQRLTDDIVHPFNDAGPSIPVGFSSANWGSLASFGARAYPNTKKWYGTSGNSFVAVVEFGDSVRARAVSAGGESGDVKSKHFNDQAERYATGNLRPVYFYPNDLQKHTERSYHPGN